MTLGMWFLGSAGCLASLSYLPQSGTYVQFGNETSEPITCRWKIICFIVIYST